VISPGYLDFDILASSNEPLVKSLRAC